MLPEDVRKKIIDIIGKSIEIYKAYETKWVEDERAKGNDADRAINVTVVRMLITLETDWQNAEKELLVLESQFRKLMPVNEKSVARRKK